MSKKNSQIINKLSADLEADIYLFNAEISNHAADTLITISRKMSERQKNVVLILTTNGGDADAGFRIMRFLQRNYKKVILYVFGNCKSAGTIMALGADEIVMSDFGQFSPIDTQISNSDNLHSSSSLDINRALDVINKQASAMLGEYFWELIKISNGRITFKTAADIASSMTAQLLAPISAQINPLHLAEMYRLMRRSSEYGQRLSSRLSKPNNIAETIGKLNYGYPTHGFVIDYEEARQLFQNVRQPTEAELLLEKLLLHEVRSQNQTGIIKWLNPKHSDNKVKNDEENVSDD